MAKDVIAFQRGNKVNMPVLAEGEPAFTLDEKRLYVGTGTENVPMGTKAEIDLISSQLEDIMYIVRPSGDSTGVTDRANITAAINTVKNNPRLKKLVLDGSFVVNIPQSYGAGIQMEDNVILEFTPNSKVSIVDNDFLGYQIIDCTDRNNFQIINPWVVGDRALKEARAFTGGGEFGHGIFLRGSKNFRVINARVEETWGDGLLIERNPTTTMDTENGYVDRMTGNRCSRNTVTISSGTNITIDEIISSNCNRTAPKAALDIEPTYGAEVLNNISIGRVKSHNDPGGVEVMLRGWDTIPDQKICDVSIDNVNLTGDTTSVCGKFYVEGPATNPAKGSICVGAIKVATVRSLGLSVNGLIENGIKVFIDSVNINIDKTGLSGQSAAMYFENYSGTNSTAHNFGTCIIKELTITGNHDYVANIAIGNKAIALSGLRLQKFMNKQTVPIKVSTNQATISDLNDDFIQVSVATIPGSPWSDFNAELYHNEGATANKYIGPYNLTETVTTLEVRASYNIGFYYSGIVIRPASLAWVDGFKCGEIGARIRFIRKSDGSIQIIDKIGNWVSFT